VPKRAWLARGTASCFARRGRGSISSSRWTRALSTSESGWPRHRNSDVAPDRTASRTVAAPGSSRSIMAFDPAWKCVGWGIRDPSTSKMRSVTFPLAFGLPDAFPPEVAFAARIVWLFVHLRRQEEEDKRPKGTLKAKMTAPTRSHHPQHRS